MHYRKEIDGFRAIAVLAVLVFHFFPESFPLGYLGVDLFFVISGFLITRLSVEEMSSGNFLFSKFYWRRVKRIVPPTFTVLLVVSVAALFILAGPDLVRYSKSLLASVGFFPNIYFWNTGGYFGLNDELKPILHMWSLGVEEQFYLLYPVFLLLVFRTTSATGLRIAAILTIVFFSYLVNVYLSSIGGKNAAFFLLPTRAWQFGVGAIAAFLAYDACVKHRFPDSVIFLALVLIGLNFFAVVPGLPEATLLTVGLGILLSGEWSGESRFRAMLVSTPVRFVGLISFSLYLWHWPIVSFLRYIFLEGIPMAVSALGIVLTFTLSYLSWRYIEEPFRKKLDFKTVLRLVCGAAFLLVALAVVIILSSGFPGRHNATVNALVGAVQTNYRCPVTSNVSYHGVHACLVNRSGDRPYDTVLLGNSHALMYGPAYIRALREERTSGLILPLTGCLPTTYVNISMNCLRQAEKNFAAVVSDSQAKKVIIATTWNAASLVDAAGQSIEDPRPNHIANALLSLAASLEETGKVVYLVGPIQIPGFDIASELGRGLMFGSFEPYEIAAKLKVDRAPFDQQYADILTTLNDELGDYLLAPHSLLCDEQSCYFGRGEDIYFADSNHLGEIGALLITPLLRDAVRGDGVN